MTDSNPTTWKMVNVIEQISEKLQLMEEYQISVTKELNEVGDWIKIANNIITDLVKDIEYLKHQKSAI